jgi:hypothetical protein
MPWPWSKRNDKQPNCSPEQFQKNQMLDDYKILQVCLNYTARDIEDCYVPVVPHKAVAEVSKTGHYGTGELL